MYRVEQIEVQAYINQYTKMIVRLIDKETQRILLVLSEEDAKLLAGNILAEIKALHDFLK